MKELKTKVTQYQSGGYVVDVVSREDGLKEAWLSPREMDVKVQMKVLMFRLDADMDYFLELVEANLEGYIKFYRKQALSRTGGKRSVGTGAG